VIETTNIKPGASATTIGVAGSPEGNRFPTSVRMRITERLTRLNDRMMLYEIKTEDPVVLTRPWTARFPLKMDNSYKWWEYACIEGNRTIPDYITPGQNAPRRAVRAFPDFCVALVLRDGPGTKARAQRTTTESSRTTKKRRTP
jgi:hypothetical protein